MGLKAGFLPKKENRNKTKGREGGPPAYGMLDGDQSVIWH